ncbi:MurR/RpiR family transcriptional regulator [Porticoccus sp. W117]|uniref:MurR/RpiR family transcriptional regulator n=1 Tax=Porticoccus sp. W117 TaxID=3054777 RepID=UPI0025930357|nr:MurR/RpiR family transcriptional regulator [Porticoccus sp. W117]MDM3870086.1 MurR/RpiR family transcriptional regulator [Porticoccus sp. W117]
MSNNISSYEQLSKAVREEYNSLSKRLKLIARYVLENPTAIALDTVAGVASNAGVQPSALIRFSKAFGFSGFTEMQKLFQEHIAQQSASYKERVNRGLDGGEIASEEGWLEQLCQANVSSLEHLSHSVNVDVVESAARCISGADKVFVIGLRRSFPIATYLAYSLGQLDCHVQLLDGAGGMLAGQASSITEKDALIAISYHSYAEETQRVLTQAKSAGASCIVMTDSPLSPIADNADFAFTVHDAEVHSFRSLATSLCLAQALVTRLAIQGAIEQD